MEMDIIDVVIADLVEVGDYIKFDGVVCAVKEKTDATPETIVFISEDDRDITCVWADPVELYGYTS